MRNGASQLSIRAESPLFLSASALQGLMSHFETISGLPPCPRLSKVASAGHLRAEYREQASSAAVSRSVG